jgi:hypothetical protein
MKNIPSFLALILALSSVVFSNAALAQATGGTTFGKCVFTARAAAGKIIAEEVKKDITAKGFAFAAATVTFSNLKSVRKTLTLADLSGVTGVTAQSDGSYLANVTGKIGMACEMTATLGIRGGGYNNTTKKRFNFFKSQQVTVLGTYQ